MKPSTKKIDAEVWKLWKDGNAPKDIRTTLGLTLSQVYKGLARERRRRKIPLLKGVGRPRKDGKRPEKRRARQAR